MSPKPSIFAHMNWIDWLLVAAFTALIAYITSLYLPVYGWPLGIIIALSLLYLAKTRRDEAYANALRENLSKDEKKDNQPPAAK